MGALYSVCLLFALQTPIFQLTSHIGDKSNHVATLHSAQLLYLAPFVAFFSFPLIFPSLLTKIFHPRQLSPCLPLYIVLLGIAVQIPIHYNTIIHPFTLADNRHYIFYVFRYSILRHPYVKYALGPVYVLCGWAIWGSFVGATPSQPKPAPKGKAGFKKPLPSSSTSDTQGNTISTVLLILLPTILSLVTAPLVEPRYFILPWVFYRLNAPSAQTTITKDKFVRTGITARYLWLETLWFLAINAGAGYMFLYRGFEWAQEPGKVQRFMW